MHRATKELHRAKTLLVPESLRNNTYKIKFAVQAEAYQENTAFYLSTARYWRLCNSAHKNRTQPVLWPGKM